MHRIRRARAVASLAIVGLAAFALVACSSAASPTPKSTATKAPTLQTLNFQLNSVPAGYNAGFEYAAVHGLYENAGLNVTITPGNGSAVTADLVASGKASIGYADAAATGPVIAKGAPMKNIMTIYQSNPDEVTVLTSSSIHSIKDLKGHTVGVPTGGSQTAMLPLLLKKNGLQQSDISEVNLPSASLAQALLQHQVDAILGSTDLYGIQVAQQGGKTRNWTFSSYGVPTVSTSVFANTDYLKQNPQIAKEFVSASLKGWAAVNKDPQAGVDAITTYFPAIVIDKDQALLQLQATLKLLCANSNPYVGKATTTAWANTQKTLSSVGVLPTGIAPTQYYSYKYLPADSQLQKCTNGKPATD